MGKDCVIIKGKELNQDEMWPIIMVCTELQFKVAVIYDDKNNIFDVKVED